MGDCIKLKKKRVFDDFQDSWNKELLFWSSKEGEELQLCLVAQGYEENVLVLWMRLLASGFSAIEIVNNLKEKLNGK